MKPVPLFYVQVRIGSIDKRWYQFNHSWSLVTAMKYRATAMGAKYESSSSVFTALRIHYRGMTIHKETF